MNNDINKYIKNHALVFGAYSLAAVIGIYSGMANRTFFLIMILYAGAIGIHALIALIGIAKFPNTKKVVLKGVLVVLGIILIGFGLCISPSIWY